MGLWRRNVKGIEKLNLQKGPMLLLCKVKLNAKEEELAKARV